MPDFAPTLRSLFPRGQVFRLFRGTELRLVVDALAEMPNRIMDYFADMRDAGIPGFITDDAVPDWEDDLALLPDSALDMDQRKLRIAGKIAGQGGQGPEYIADTLQAAGFPVYVFENIPSREPSVRHYVAALGDIELGEVELAEYTDRIDPRSLVGHLIYGSPIWETVKNYTAALGDGELGDYSLGEYSGTRVIEVAYTIPATASRFIFIWILAGEAGINHFVDIPAERETDFRRLVESIKPTHTWCIAQVNFV